MVAGGLMAATPRPPAKAATARDWAQLEAEAAGESEASTCRALWRAVIERALLDAAEPRERANVAAWLGARDFERVCMAADVCARQARAVIEAALQGPARSMPAPPRRRVDHPRRPLAA